MAKLKTPDIYNLYKNPFPNPVVEVPTAIPAFIGITEKALSGEDSLSYKPWKITSLTEFQHFFGEAPEHKFILSVAEKPVNDSFFSIESVKDKDGKTTFLSVKNDSVMFSLYYHMVMFFANGGGTCYIVSMGTYDKKETIDKAKVVVALEALKKEPEITMIVVPEAASARDCNEIQTQVLKHCGEMNRFAILDVQPKKDNETMRDQIGIFRTNVGEDYLSYGAAYYPWLNTSVLSDKDIDGTMLTWDYAQKNEDKMVVPDLSAFFNSDSKFPDYFKFVFTDIVKRTKKIMEEKNIPYPPDELAAIKNDLHNAFLRNLPDYQCIVNKIREKLNLLPPSAAMAGLYTTVDNTRGVWKAPANISLKYVNSLTENINFAMQEDFNTLMNGKAVNAICSFPGEGIKVWGARTLDGNSHEWRYVSVRRTIMFLEESLKNAAKMYVLEPNVAATWINVRSMIDNFLCNVWQRSGLAGSTQEDAFKTYVGLGETMIGDDIMNGIMRITVLVALTRPSEFIEITFEQQMQKS